MDIIRKRFGNWVRYGIKLKTIVKAMDDQIRHRVLDPYPIRYKMMELEQIKALSGIKYIKNNE